MGFSQRVEVPQGGGHADLSEAQGRKRERPSGGSAERDLRADEQEPDMRRSSLGRAAGWSRSSVTKRGRRRSGGCAGKAEVLIWGDLALGL